MLAQQHGLLETVLALGLPGLEEHLDIDLLLRSPGSRTGEGVQLRVVPFCYPLCIARRPPDIGTAASQEALQRIRQIADHMEPVGNLDRLGSRFSCRCRVLGGAISTDDFHLRMSVEPLGKRAPTAIFQQIHDVCRSRSTKIVPSRPSQSCENCVRVLGLYSADSSPTALRGCVQTPGRAARCWA